MRKGYKAMINSQCLDFMYEVGQTYEIDGEIEICKKGFHYCKIMSDVLNYYFPEPGLEIFEIEDLGDQYHEKEDKSVTNKIKILRKVPREEFDGFDFYQDGNKIFFEEFGRFSSERTYNENGQMLTYKDSTGLYTYDENGQMLTYKDSMGFFRDFSKKY